LGWKLLPRKNHWEARDTSNTEHQGGRLCRYLEKQWKDSADNTENYVVLAFSKKDTLTTSGPAGLSLNKSQQSKF